MTDAEVEDAFVKLATRLAKPVLNKEVARPTSPRVQPSDGLCEILWECGFLPATSQIRALGATTTLIEKTLAKYKRLFEIVEPEDLVELGADLETAMRTYYDSEFSNELPVQVQRLDEQVIKEIYDFKVEMFTNEGQHAGRPHVKVRLKGGAISVSLDDPPQNLTPKGGLVGEASAIKVIAKFRGMLLKRWHGSRPDTQKLNPKAKN